MDRFCSRYVCIRVGLVFALDAFLTFGSSFVLSFVSRCDSQGGTTKLKGFAPRLLTELRAGAVDGTKVRIHAPADRLTSAFTGGTILASLTTFRNMAISSEEYFEHGESIVHRKTF